LWFVVCGLGFGILGFWGLGFGFWVLGFGFFGFWVLGLEKMYFREFACVVLADGRGSYVVAGTGELA
jgi:hypothetical protein